MSTAAKKPSKTKAPKAKAAPKASNPHAKRERALKMREAGKTYAEIAKAIGWANGGVAANAVKRAKEAAAA